MSARSRKRYCGVQPSVWMMPDKAAETPPDSAPPCLALRPKDAARALGIGERLLWSKTNSGEIPCVRIGRAVVYPVNLLRDYLDQQAKVQ